MTQKSLVGELVETFYYWTGIMLGMQSYLIEPQPLIRTLPACYLISSEILYIAALNYSILGTTTWF